MSLANRSTLNIFVIMVLVAIVVWQHLVMQWQDGCKGPVCATLSVQNWAGPTTTKTAKTTDASLLQSASATTGVISNGPTTTPKSALTRIPTVNPRRPIPVLPRTALYHHQAVNYSEQSKVAAEQDLIRQATSLVQGASLNETYFHVARLPVIGLEDATQPKFVFLVWIVNFESEKEYCVTAVAPGRATRAAMQTVGNHQPNALKIPDNVSNNGTTTLTLPVIEFLLIPPAVVAGEYELLVHEIVFHDFPVLVPPLGNLSRVLEFPERAYQKDPLPPCQRVSGTGLLPWEGNWVGPGVTLEEDNEKRHTNRLRTGWSFKPASCSLETFSHEELMTMSLSSGADDKLAAVNATSPTTIAVLGTSRERGIFLSMVDMLLSTHEKQNLQYSKVGKCWGRASVQLNGFKLIYQDIRMEMCDIEEVDGTVTCHGNLTAGSSGYLKNVTIMVKELFLQEQWPQVVVLGFYSPLTRAVINGQPHQYLVSAAKILESIPSEWNGTVYVCGGFLSALQREVNQEDLEKYLESLMWMDRYFGDPRVVVLDLYRLSTDMRLAAEKVGQIHGSSHSHRWCNENDMRVCSNVTEALANLMIGRAVAPTGKAHWHPVPTGKTTERTLEICTDCPASLMPFHCKPRPDLVCTGSLTETKIAGAAWAVPSCPKSCLQTSPVDYQVTQSGKVPVRICSPHLLLQGTNSTN